MFWSGGLDFFRWCCWRSQCCCRRGILCHWSRGWWILFLEDVGAVSWVAGMMGFTGAFRRSSHLFLLLWVTCIHSLSVFVLSTSGVTLLVLSSASLCCCQVSTGFCVQTFPRWPICLHFQQRGRLSFTITIICLCTIGKYGYLLNVHGTFITYIHNVEHIKNTGISKFENM